MKHSHGSKSLPMRITSLDVGNSAQKAPSFPHPETLCRNGGAR